MDEWSTLYDVLWSRIRQAEEDVVLQGEMVDDFYRLTSEILSQQE